MKPNPYIRRMFAGANTSEGFVNFFGEILAANTNRVFIIKGGPGVGKSTFMKKTGQELLSKGYDLEYFHCSSDPDSLDALAVPQLKAAVMDGTSPHIMDPLYPGAVEELICFGNHWNDEVIVSNRKYIIECVEHGKWLFKTAYALLKEASIAYNQWKSNVFECLDKTKYQHKVNLFVNQLFRTLENGGNNSGTRHYFACAITPLGIRDHAAALFRQGMQIYPIYGEPGCGTREVMRRIAQIAQWQGYFTERFHCPIEPEELDMVLIPGLNAAVISICEPVRSSIPDVAEADLKEGLNLTDCLLSGTFFEKYRTAAADARERFTTLMEKAIKYIARAKAVHDELEGYYVPAVDFDKIEQLRCQVVQRILKYEWDN